VNTIDLIVLLALAVAVWNGWRKGFIVQICSLAALIAGVWLAAHYGRAAGEALRLEPSAQPAGGFVAVFLAAILAIAAAARAMRKLFRFAGFGMLDIALGVAVSALKYMLAASVLFAAFDQLNRDHTLVGAETVETSKSYGPMLKLSKAIRPFFEWVGDRMPLPEERQPGKETQEET